MLLHTKLSAQVTTGTIQSSRIDCLEMRAPDGSVSIIAVFGENLITVIAQVF
jgi:hypothetical protein